MTESNGPLSPAFAEPSSAEPPAGRWGATLTGALLVAIGASLLAERSGFLPLHWRGALWPALLIVFGATSLLRPTPDGRRGLFFVLAGAWWLAGQAGWISMVQTWPLLIVGLGASVVLEAMTASPDLQRRRGFYGRRESGLMPLVLVAILAGALFSQRDHLGTLGLTSDGGFRAVSIMGGTRHHLSGDQVTGGAVFTVMGTNVLDVSQATVRPGTPIVIDGLTLMGRSVIYVPDNWQVDLNTVSLFGVVRDRRVGTTAPPATAVSAPVGQPAAPPTRVQLRGVVLLGGIDLRSPGDSLREREESEP